MHKTCDCLNLERLLGMLLDCVNVLFTCLFVLCFQRGETVLHIACRIRNINIVRLLLRNGAAVDAKTQVSWDHLFEPVIFTMNKNEL